MIKETACQFSRGHRPARRNQFPDQGMTAPFTKMYTSNMPETMNPSLALEPFFI